MKFDGFLKVYNEGRDEEESWWGDTKVAALVTYTSPEFTQDPLPEPPAAFLGESNFFSVTSRWMV